MDAVEAIITRRSTRRFDARSLDREVIERVVDAGRHAPSGGNNQATHLIIITDRRVLQELAELVQDAFAQMEAGPDTYASLRRSIAA